MTSCCWVSVFTDSIMNADRVMIRLIVTARYDILRLDIEFIDVLVLISIKSRI